MISKLYLWLAGILAVIATFAGVRHQAKSQGKKEAIVEQQNQVIKNVIEAKKVTDFNANITTDAKRDRLRDKLKHK